MIFFNFFGIFGENLDFRTPETFGGHFLLYESSGNIFPTDFVTKLVKRDPRAPGSQGSGPRDPRDPGPGILGPQAPGSQGSGPRDPRAPGPGIPGLRAPGSQGPGIPGLRAPGSQGPGTQGSQGPFPTIFVLIRFPVSDQFPVSSFRFLSVSFSSV